MRVPPSFNQAYRKVLPTLERLEQAVGPRAREIASRHNGSYSGRIKQPESILIKAERNGYQNPFQEMDDLFACTITVPNSLAVRDVRHDVEQAFSLVKVRQREVKPEEFAYNDLNLSLKVIQDFSNQGEAYVDLVFELQIKTLLQQAWSQASHDVVYKAGRKTWGLARIASQLRALLEMADSVLANLQGAADTLQGTIKYPNYETTNQLITVLEAFWDPSSLPSDLDRAAQVVKCYLDLARLTSDDLERLLESDKYRLYAEAHSLPPTQAVFIILFSEKWSDMGPRLKKRKVLITTEMQDLCPALAKIPPELRMDLGEFRSTGTSP